MAMDNIHYMSMKQPLKMTMGHLRVWHLMLLVVYKLQPMCLFRKKVTHEEIFTYLYLFKSIEVIDIPRNSPLVLNDHKRLTKRTFDTGFLNMNNNDDDDDAPIISPPMSPLTRNNQSDNDEQYNAKRFMDKFKSDRTSNLLES